MKHFTKAVSAIFTVLGATLVLSSCYHHVAASAPPPPAPAYVMPPPPPWAPPYNDREHVRYYYMPDMECYYDVYMQQYVYFDGFAWIHSPYPPAAYSSYNMYNGYVVVLNSRVSDPWQNHSSYQSTYPRGSGNTTGTESLNGPRRGYNENDKSALYQHSTPRNADGTPVENQSARPKPPKQRPAETDQQQQTPPPPAPVKAPKQMKQPMEETPEVAPPQHKKEPAPEKRPEPKSKQQAPKKESPKPGPKGQKPQNNPQ